MGGTELSAGTCHQAALGQLGPEVPGMAISDHVARIVKPLFVVQGLNDPRVPYTEAEQIVANLKQRGTPVWFLMAKDEGHGFVKKPNADFQFYATAEFVRQTLLK